ncbi:emp24/gp25L/p24 family protein [Medicago truncatula]|uniref:Emp24/gp25L/p24 family protein n=1 Tax=Medicago truncatula TaxID=3880 RepID=G7JWH9_MEDTR|nr:emp24/gp25L/p24 family protein [Medicago truncatula]
MTYILLERSLVMSYSFEYSFPGCFKFLFRKKACSIRAIDTYTTYQSEEYIICFFSTTDNPQVTLSVDFEWKTAVKALGRPNIAKRNQIDKMAFEVYIMHEKALSIKEEMSYLPQRMFLWIFVSLFVTFSVAGLQLWHLKTFFQKKKLI